MDGVHESYHTRLGRHDDRVSPGTAPKIPDPAQGLTGGDPCRREEHVGATDQVVQRKLPLGVCKAVLFELLDLGALRRPHPGLHLPAEALHDGRCEDAFRCTSYTDDGVQVGPTHSHGDGRGEVALRPYLNTRSCLSDLLYQGLVPVALQDGDCDLLRPASESLRYGLNVLRDGVVNILPLGAAATAEIEPSCPFTSNCKPSMGSTARSASGPLFPSGSSTLTIPGWLFGALTRPFSSRRCSRSTVTVPDTGTRSSSSRKASVASV